MIAQLAPPASLAQKHAEKAAAHLRRASYPVPVDLT